MCPFYKRYIYYILYGTPAHEAVTSELRSDSNYHPRARPAGHGQCTCGPQEAQMRWHTKSYAEQLKECQP